MHHMTEYHGIGKEYLVASVKSAETFLRLLNLGPATDRMLDERFSYAFYATLNAADSPASLTKAILHIQAESPFVENMLVFYYHAILDTDGMGKEVYDGLNAWGAFSGTLFSYDATRAAERKAHIITLETDKTAELRNGYKIPHPSRDTRRFKPPQP